MPSICSFFPNSFFWVPTLSSEEYEKGKRKNYNSSYGPLPGVAAARPEKSVTVDPTHVDSKLDRPEQKEDVCDDDDDDDDDDESYCRDHAWSTPPTHEHSTRETGAERRASRASHDLSLIHI